MNDDSETLAEAARRVLAELHPVDFDRVRAKFAARNDLTEARSEMVGAMVRRAESMLRARAAGGAGAVPPEQLGYLLGATLTFGDQHRGIHARSDNALRKFAVMVRQPGVPLAMAVLLTAEDSDELVTALTAAYELDTAVAVELPYIAEDERRLVVAALAANPALTPPGHQPPATAIRRIFERSAALASHCVAARLMPRRVPALLGNADFLVSVAGYARAVAELLDPALPMDDPHGDVRGRAERLAHSLHRASTETGNAHYGGPQEPDILGFYTVAAEAVGGPLAAAVYARFGRELWSHRLRRDSTVLAVEPDALDRAGAYVGVTAGVDGGIGTAFDDAEELAGRIAALAVMDTTAATQNLIFTWIAEPEQLRISADQLQELLGCVRRVMTGVRDTRAAPPPDDTRGGLVEELTAVLLRRLTDLAAHDSGRSALELTATALPELWSRRETAVRALTQKIRADVGMSPSKLPWARVLAAAVARGPGQVFLAQTAPAQHATTSDDSACTTATTANDTERCNARIGRPGPRRDEQCPARPWGETGIVDNYRSLADVYPTSPETLSKRFTRYEGVWAPLAEPGRP